MSSTKYILNRDISGAYSDGLSFSQDGYGVALVANAEQNFTVPSNYPAWEAVFEYSRGATVYVDNINTAAIPTATIGITTVNINPEQRCVKAGSVLSFISADTDAVVVVRLYVKAPYIN